MRREESISEIVLGEEFDAGCGSWNELKSG
jgi:hypothetical protein